MKKYLLALVAFSLLSVPAFALAKDFTWARSADLGPDGKEDVKQYHLYVCKVPAPQTCIATNTGTMWLATIPQTAVGITPTFPVPAEINGSAVVTAEDFAGNVSLPSNMVSFNTVSDVKPLPPTLLKVQ